MVIWILQLEGFYCIHHGQHWYTAESALMVKGVLTLVNTFSFYLQKSSIVPRTGTQFPAGLQL